MSKIDESDDRRWVADGSRVTPGRRLEAPFAAGEDDVCALPAGELREGPSCAKGEGRGNGRQQQPPAWAVREAERPESVPVARHPVESFIPVVPPFSPSYFYQDVTARLFRFCLSRESLEPADSLPAQEGRGASADVKSAEAKASLLEFDTLHRSSFKPKRRLLLGPIRHRASSRAMSPLWKEISAILSPSCTVARWDSW